MRIYQADAFTNQLFKGNPAGVCILPEPIEDMIMQKIAMEMNLSETAFLVKKEYGYDLRWFTPEIEVDLCGHATLASAHILWETNLLSENEKAIFNTKSGELIATKEGYNITLDFPIEEDWEVEPPAELVKSLGVPIIYIGQNRLDYIVQIDEANLFNLSPNLDLMKRVDKRGVIVTSRSTNSNYDFISRFFAPHAGIPEDPVTGSAHCCLGPYWKRKLGKNEFNAYQASSRGGELHVKVGESRVFISGQAVTVFSAELKDLG